MKIRAAILLGLALGSLPSLTAFAVTEGQWVEGGMKFQKPDGSLARNEWIEGENNSYFYVGADGSYVTGWHEIKEKNSDASHDYYFNPADGAMFYNSYTPDGYWVNGDGVWTGEVKDGSVSEKPAGEAAMQESGEKAQTSASETETAVSAAETTAAEAASQTAEPGVISDGYSEENAAALSALLTKKRAEVGKPALTEDPALQKAAEIRAAEIAAYDDDSRIYLRPVQHYLSEAKGTGSEMTNSSVTAVEETARRQFTKGSSILITESAAWGVESPEEAVSDWFAKNSDGRDKSNKSFILDTGNNGFNAIGVSCYIKDGRQYYSVFLGVKQ